MDIQDLTAPEFFAQLPLDLKNTKFHAVIHTGHLAFWRIGDLRAILKPAIDRGVRVCVFAQSPDSELHPADQKTMDDFHAKVKILKVSKSHVTVRREAHEKIVILDGLITYTGSLNVLSHGGRTSELMTRRVDRNTALYIMKKFRLDNCEECDTNVLTDSVTCEDRLGTLGAQVRQIRKACGMTQSKLAERMNAANCLLSHIENGERSVRIETISRVCDEMNQEFRLLPKFMIPSINEYLESIYGSRRQKSKKARGEINPMKTKSANELSDFKPF